MSKLTWRPKPKPLDLTSMFEQLARNRVSPHKHLTISPTTKQPIRPSKGRHINPNSPEGKLISSKYL
jgi:hypothetical protein